MAASAVAVDFAELTQLDRTILGTSSSAQFIGQLSEAERRSIHAPAQPRIRQREKAYYSGGQCHVLRWRDLGQELPTWFDATMQGLADVLALQVDWDGYGAKAIHASTIKYALFKLDGLLLNSSPAGQVVPLANGGIQVEWHLRGVDFELVFEPGKEPAFYHRNRVSNMDTEGSLKDNMDFVRQVIASFS